MKRKPSGEERARKLFSVALFFSWISFMAVAGFFVPSFLVQLPLFQIKKIEVEGNREITLEEVRSAIRETGSNLIGLGEKELRDTLNRRFGNRIEKVFLSRSFTPEGVVLRIRLEERVPVVKVKLGRGYLLMDAKGNLFNSGKTNVEGLPELRTFDINVLRENFSDLYRKVLSVDLPIKRVVVHKDRIVLELPGKEVLLPPLQSLPDNLSVRLLMVYNFPQEKVDLRYDRFILVGN